MTQACADTTRSIHVVGRTPGPLGKAPMVAVAGGVEMPLEQIGSHHEAAYLAAIIAMANARDEGVTRIEITSTSEHLVRQMNGEWEVGPELAKVNEAAHAMAALFDSAEFTLKQ